MSSPNLSYKSNLFKPALFRYWSTCGCIESWRTIPERTGDEVREATAKSSCDWESRRGSKDHAKNMNYFSTTYVGFWNSFIGGSFRFISMEHFLKKVWWSHINEVKWAIENEYETSAKNDNQKTIRKSYFRKSYHIRNGIYPYNIFTYYRNNTHIVIETMPFSRKDIMTFPINITLSLFLQQPLEKNLRSPKDFSTALAFWLAKVCTHKDWKRKTSITKYSCRPFKKPLMVKLPSGMSNCTDVRHDENAANTSRASKAVCKEHQQFFDSNAKKEGVISSLRCSIQIIKEGTGALVKPESTIQVHYTGSLVDGTVL